MNSDGTLHTKLKSDPMSKRENANLKKKALKLLGLQHLLQSLASFHISFKLMLFFASLVYIHHLCECTQIEIFENLPFHPRTMLDLHQPTAGSCSTGD